jgi:hypothetical protein
MCRLTVRGSVVVATLYGTDGRIVGGGSVDLGRDLPANGKAPFTVTIADTAALPKTFAVRAVGSPD